MSFLRILFGPPDVDKMETERNLPGLIKALGYRKEPSIRYRSAIAMGKIGDHRAVKPLIFALDDKDLSVREGAVNALREIGDSAIELLIIALKDKKFYVRLLAVEAMKQICDQRFIEPLIVALGDNEDNHLFRPGTSTKVSENILFILGAFKTLEKIGVPAVDQLIISLKHTVAYVRQCAASTLKVIGDPRSIQPLVVALQDKEPQVVEAVSSALKKMIGGEKPTEALKFNEISFNSLKSPVFEWSKSSFVGSNQALVDKVQHENSSAIVWFNAQHFAPIPTFGGERGAAEYCFDMASQAQGSGIVQEAWAGFHQALRRFAQLQNEKMLGLTCFNLGKVYGNRENWEMAQLMFLQSAYLTNKIGEEKGYAWALSYLGDTSDKLGKTSLAIQFISEALPVFQKVSPGDVPGVNAALRRLKETIK